VQNGEHGLQPSSTMVCLMHGIESDRGQGGSSRIPNASCAGNAVGMRDGSAPHLIKGV
jgi:hypothetical protein